MTYTYTLVSDSPGLLQTGEGLVIEDYGVQLSDTEASQTRPTTLPFLLNRGQSNLPNQATLHDLVDLVSALNTTQLGLQVMSKLAGIEERSPRWCRLSALLYKRYGRIGTMYPTVLFTGARVQSEDGIMCIPGLKQAGSWYPVMVPLNARLDFKQHLIPLMQNAWKRPAT